jgi:hypothetical protein
MNLLFINLFIILLVEIANKMGSQKKLNFCGRKTAIYLLTVFLNLSNLFIIFIQFIF